MIRLIALIIIISSTAWAEEVEKFGGLQSTKKDGVIVIEISPTADREKLRKQAEIDGQKARQKAIQTRIQNESRDRARPYRVYSSPSKPAPEYKYKSSSENRKDYYERKERILEREERDHVGPLPKWKYNSIREREARYKREIEDAEKYPD